MMSGCRISQHLREHNPRYLALCSFNSNKHRCFNYNKASAAAPCRHPFCFSQALRSRRFSRFELLGTNASYSSSSSLTNDSDILAGVSSVNTDNDNCDEDTSGLPAISDCLRSAETGRIPSSEEVTSVAGGIVALGKFDALHIGHRELAIQASKIGVPFLLSFVGMAEVLGWEPRAPIVAKCDRKRVLSSWAPLCGNVIPKEYHVDFSKVRHLSPQQFVEKLSKDLGVHGVVAGKNYRFGYKAVGDVSDLVRLCNDYGMRACIANSVMDKNQKSADEGSSNSKEQGQVSSTRVRYALSHGDVKYVSELLGRPHRLILKVKSKGKLSRHRKRLSTPRSCLLNLPPKEGLYNNCSLVIADENVVPCRIIIDTTDIHLELDELAPHINIAVQNLDLLSIDFGDSKAQVV